MNTLPALKDTAKAGRSILNLPKVQAFLDRMIFEGEDVKTAALAVGLRVRRARALLRNPAVRRAYTKGVVELRENERARNIHLAVRIRNDGMLDGATAASKKVALEAARYLDGETDGGGITINGGQNVIAGYVINLDGPSEGPKLIQDQRQVDAKPLIDRENVADA